MMLQKCFKIPSSLSGSAPALCVFREDAVEKQKRHFPGVSAGGTPCVLPQAFISIRSCWPAALRR